MIACKSVCFDTITKLLKKIFMTYVADGKYVTARGSIFFIY